MRGATVVLALLLTALAAAPAAAQPACGEVITEDTTLTGDMQCGGSPALVIGAPHLTLDLGGHHVDSWATAIRNPGHADVAIRDGSVSGETSAILLEGATANRIRNVDVGGLVSGIRLVDSDANRILSNHLVSASLSIGVGSDHNVVRGNHTRGREATLSIRGAHNRVVDNFVWTGDDGAVGLFEAHHNAIRRNVFITSFETLLGMQRSNDNTVADNTFVAHDDHRGAGAVIVDSARNRFVRNDFDGVPQGIVLRSGADNVFRANDLHGAVLPTFAYPDPDGFLVEAAATGTILRANSVHGFADDGIDVEAPGTLIGRNAANANGDLGMEAVAGVVDGAGNRASGNGNPLQCVNVLCR